MCLLKTKEHGTVKPCGTWRVPQLTGRTASCTSAFKSHVGAELGRNAAETVFLSAYVVQPDMPFCCSCFFIQLLCTFRKQWHAGQFHPPAVPLFPEDTVQGQTGKGCSQNSCSCHCYFPIWLCRKCTAQIPLAVGVGWQRGE